MNKRILLIILVFLAVTFYSSEVTTLNLTFEEEAWLRQHPVIRIAPDPKFPPIEWIDENNEYRGVSSDFIDLIAEKLDVEFEVVSCKNWNEVLRLARERKVDLLPAAAQTPDRGRYMLFSDPHLIFPGVIITTGEKKGLNATPKLYGKKVGIVSGYVWEEFIGKEHPGINIVEVENVIDGLRRVATDEIDAFIATLPIALYYIEREGIHNLVVAGQTEYETKLSILTRKDWPLLNTIVQKALNSIPESSRSAIIRKWITIEQRSLFYQKKFWVTVLSLLIAGILAVLVVLTWNASLKRQVREKTRGLQEYIAQLEKAEKVLAAERENLANVIEGTRAGTWRWNVQTGEKAYNERWAEIIGYTLDELTPASVETWEKLVHPEDLTKSNALLKKHFSGELPYYVCSCRMKHKDGRWVWIHDRGRVITWTKDGDPLMMFGIDLDINDRKQAEEEQKKLRAQLIQSQKMESVGRLAGGIAHDFNNMLNIILGYSQMIFDQLPADSPLISDIEEVKKAARRSAELTQRLLAFARKQTIEPRVLDLNETVSGMLKMLRRLIREEIEILWKPEENLWPIEADPSQIDQILTNLCVNASDAINGPGKVIMETCNVYVDEEYSKDDAEIIKGDFVMLRVTDDGTGMDEDVKKNIFDPFFTTKEKDKGTGLGLSTVYGIVKQNNGFIDVCSEKRKGTSIRIYLPRLEEAEDETPRIKNKQEEIPVGDETILLVEDEPAILKVTQRMLQDEGYRVFPADSPDKAQSLALKHKNDIDLLITDVVMPGMNGRELAENLLSIQPRIKCLFMSGYTSDVVKGRWMLDERARFIHKPFTASELLAKIVEILSVPD
ncbi:MAG TPA: transporter substrate-binding domain-containing protein [Candidatus Krumholzibacteriaceae bacterium]|nr:transporter substrate-binding domain-containing protein [Candidatus Krumholzibacteriaceae bacterium]